MICNIKKNIKKHALSNFSEEVCGIVFEDKFGKACTVECNNIHPDKENCFQISLEDLYFVKNKYKILSIYHSHPKSKALPTGPDIANSEENGYPLYIYSIPEDDFYLHRPLSCSYKPLKQRNFTYDIYNCITCVLDFFVQKFGPSKISKEFDQNFVVPKDVDQANQVIYNCMKNSSKFANVRLEEVEPDSSLKINDILIMDFMKKIPYHVGVISKQDKMLHHFLNRLSGEDQIRDLWTKACVKRFRVI